MMTNAGTKAQDALFDLEHEARYSGPSTDHLWDARWIRDHAERLIASQVATLREQGVSWAAVAEILGVTRQAAQQRYGAER